MDEERKRLASVRVHPEEAGVQEVVRISGQALGSANRVMMEDLLRKPRISHRQVNVVTSGKCKPRGHIAVVYLGIRPATSARIKDIQLKKISSDFPNEL